MRKSKIALKDGVVIPQTQGCLDLAWEVYSYGHPSMTRIYEANPKHKPGHSFGDSPRFFPDGDTPCPDDVSIEKAKTLLSNIVEFDEKCSAERKVGFVIDELGRIFKGFTHLIQDEKEYWHGFYVRPGKIRRDVPPKALNKLKSLGLISEKRYRELV